MLKKESILFSSMEQWRAAAPKKAQIEKSEQTLRTLAKGVQMNFTSWELDIPKTILRAYYKLISKGATPQIACDMLAYDVLMVYGITTTYRFCHTFNAWPTQNYTVWVKWAEEPYCEGEEFLPNL